jgi:hypothetical protein
MMLPPSAAAITASWSRANPGVGEKVYAPRKVHPPCDTRNTRNTRLTGVVRACVRACGVLAQGDEIDAKLAEVANSKGLEVPFVWVKEGMYKFGGKARLAFIPRSSFF